MIPKGRGISIVWSYGDDDGGKRINSVIIEYALKNTSRWGSVFVQNYPQVQHYTFNNLRPHTSYKFRVYAVNEIGKSSASAMRFGTTQLGSVDNFIMLLGKQKCANVPELIIVQNISLKTPNSPFRSSTRGLGLATLTMYHGTVFWDRLCLYPLKPMVHCQLCYYQLALVRVTFSLAVCCPNLFTSQSNANSRVRTYLPAN